MQRRGSSRRLVEETCGSSGSEVIRNGLPRFKGYITVRWSGMFLLDFCIELHGSKMVMEPFREALNCLARAQRENSVGSSVRRRCMRLLYQIPPQPPGVEGVCVCECVCVCVCPEWLHHAEGNHVLSSLCSP